MGILEQPCFVKPYDHNIFHSLGNLTTVHGLLLELGVSEYGQRELRALFKRHGTANSIGLWVPHRHFSMSENERLVEYGQIATPWLVRGKSVLGGRIVPKSWVFRKGGLYPVEFGFNPSTTAPGNNPFPEIRLPQAFVTELYRILEGEGVQDILGLTTVDNVDEMLKMGTVVNVERTIGRVSVMLPGSIKSTKAMEVSWTFGCSKALSDSQLFAAKICWVCEDCEDAYVDDGLLDAGL